MRDPAVTAVLSRERSAAEIQEWTRARIEQAASSRREQTVSVPDPLPVHVLYWTAWTDAAGVLHLRDDVYDRDGALYAAMKRRM